MWLANARSAWSTRHSDAGFMLPMAMFITMIAVAASTLVVILVMFTSTQTQIGEARVQDNATAEAGLDAALASIEQSTGTNLPCSFSGTANPANGTTYSVAMRYFSQNPSLDGSGNPVPLVCPLTATPYQVEVTSTGQSTGNGPAGSTATQRMRALVRLQGGSASPLPWTRGFAAAVSVGTSFSHTFRLDVTGAGGNVYVTGNYLCDSVANLSGNLYSSGTMQLGNNKSDDCRITGDTWSGGNMRVDDPSRVGGTVKVAGSLQLTKKLTVGGGTGNAYYQSVSGSGGSMDFVGNIWGPPAMVGPPLPTRPQVVYNVADWSGWSIVSAAPGAFPCTNGAASTSGPITKTVYNTTCTPAWDGTGSSQALVLRSDMTIFVSSFRAIDTLNVTSSGGSYTLRIIVPSASLSAACAPTPTKNLYFDKAITTDAASSVLLFTSGSTDLGVNSNFYGQVFGCGVTTKGTTTINYRSVGAPSSESAGTATYTADVVYIRDV